MPTSQLHSDARSYSHKHAYPHTAAATSAFSQEEDDIAVADMITGAIGFVAALVASSILPLLGVDRTVICCTGMMAM